MTDHSSRPHFGVISATKRLCCAVGMTGLLSISGHAVANSAAQAVTSAQIEQAANAFILAQNPWPNARVSVAMMPLDSRLQLRACAEPLQAELGPGARISANTSLQILCPGQQGWRIFTRVNVSAFAPVMVANQAMTMNQFITEKDVRYVEHDIAKLPYGFYASLPNEPGIRLKTTAAAGSVITPLMTSPIHAVSRGNTVKIYFRNGAVQVVMSGTALANGHIGDTIMVKNTQSGRSVQGRVTGMNTVETN